MTSFRRREHIKKSVTEHVCAPKTRWRLSDHTCCMNVKGTQNEAELNAASSVEYASMLWYLVNLCVKRDGTCGCMYDFKCIYNIM